MLLAPTLLAPIWRYASDDWSGTNALIYTIYTVDPVYASDGVTITTAGTPTNITGCTAQGVILFRATGQPMPAPVGAVLSPTAGTISLSLSRDKTDIAGQSRADWGTPDASLLLVRYRVLDASSTLVTHGIQPLFVF